ncbi:hypothetical protein D3C79_924630 [compost metagenome]
MTRVPTRIPTAIIWAMAMASACSMRPATGITVMAMMSSMAEAPLPAIACCISR